jgi:chaperone LolA
MKKLFLTLIVMNLSWVVASAQPKEAQKLLEDVINKVSGYKNFEADLSYTMVNKEMDINEEKQGKIFVEGDKYRIEMPGQIIISDGKTLWTYLEDSEEVMVSNLEDNDESISPTKILTSYNKDYEAKFASDPKYKKGELKLIYLKPGNKNKNFEKMSVLVDSKKKDLISFSVYDKNGNVFTYHILNLKPNVSLPSDTFTFDPEKYPDVEVVDMR